MAGIDWLIIGAYFVLLIGIVWWSSRKQDTTADYFLAGRNVGWFAVGASLFASNIGSEHVVGLAGQGASTGMAMAHYELHAWIMLMLGWFFVPFYHRAGVFTMPEFLERRYSPRVRWVLSIVSLAAYVLTKVSVTVYAGAVVFRTLLPDTFGSPENAFWVGAFSTVILTGIYTIFGGLRAVVYTEVAQTALLLAGSAFITYFGLSQLGGWGELKLMAADNARNFALWRPLDDPNFPWLGILIASPIVGIWYWCTDQYIVQRTLAAKNMTEARRGAIWGAFLKVWPVFIFLIPGMIGWALHQKGLIQVASDADGNLDGNMVFPTMVASLLPAGLRGLVVAALLSALMSSLSSLFNSCATLFTKDIYEKIRPGLPEKQLVRVGRFATGIVVVLGIVWIPIMPLIAGGGLYFYLQNVQGYLAPAITVTFLLGMLWTRATAAGAIAGLATGFGLGMIKMLLQGLNNSQMLGESGPLVFIAKINFLYFSGILALISMATIVAVSLATPAPDKAKIAGLTYGSLTPEQRAAERRSWNWVDLASTGVVLGFVIAVYLYFSFWLG